MTASIISLGANQTLKWEVLPGDYIVWVGWHNVFSPNPEITIHDFWETREGDLVSITSNIEDLPAWFELHPTEVAGYKACLMMERKLKSGWQPGDRVDGPNLWRVMTGDRVLWVSGVEAEGKDDPKHTVVVFRNNALVFGERTVHPNDLVWFMSFGAPLESPPTERVASLVRVGLEEIRKLGSPREIADIGSGWCIGS
jgi:hypothetical protein